MFKVRKFFFEADAGSAAEYGDVIRHALEDEGCFLMLGQRERLVCVQNLVPEYGRVMDVIAVPVDRIVPVWTEA